ncbi:MAG: beta galactosidase jelly roll domain-containing protein [Bacteroidales bacterium]|nr:MAG: beta galactosidase jelly roll domain-containing protein [Bacteroidales bacterium]
MKKIAILSLVMLLFISCEYEEGKIRNLKGTWRFAIGDNKEWASPEFDDSRWDRIYAPARWEKGNYYNYNGYAWYRKSFRLTPKYKDSKLYLYLGRIDDVDEVYVNGKLIASTGSFPPDFKTAATTYRKYVLPSDIIDFNKDNLIAVRVYDVYAGGGIVRGDLGIYTSGLLTADLNLEGEWKFKIKDSLIWKEVDYQDENWDVQTIPGIWEEQGYEDYDGFAWYRKRFDLPADLKSQKLVALFGKIDDLDQVYLNGDLLGYTGEFNPRDGEMRINGEYMEFRGYYIPDNIQLQDTGNVIAIRVYDSHGVGGLYEGPVGLITQDNYTRYWNFKAKRKRRTRFDDLMIK